MAESSVHKYVSEVKQRIKDHSAISTLFNSSFAVNFKGSYRYKPLNRAVKEIRLLTLLPGPLSSEIRVLLQPSTLEARILPEYEALSYAWGSMECLSEIRVGALGKAKLPITRNLEDALRYLRYKDKPRTLWIDAICVNQQDPDERGHQVQCMNAIYTNARRVVVWLGPADDLTQLAMDLLKEISSKIEVNWQLRSMKPVFRDGSEHHWGDLDIDSPLNSHQWKALGAFFDRAWFGRLWIWQEIWLADQEVAIMQSGSHSVRWQVVKDAIYCLAYQNSSNQSIHEILSRAFNVAAMLPSTLHSLAWQTRQAKCSDDRDRIYALLSLDSRETNIIPDYTKSTGQVYQEVALAILMTPKGNDLFQYCTMTRREKDMPSWVPDWSDQDWQNLLPTYNAFPFNGKEGYYLGNGIFSVKGIIQEKLTLVTPIDLGNGYYSGILEAMYKLVSMSGLDDLCCKKDGFLDACCRMLCGDRFSENFEPLQTYYPNFGASREFLRDLVDGHLDKENLSLAAMQYLNIVASILEGRVLIKAEKGHFGLGPITSQANDQICFINGCDAPLVLRPSVDGQYKIVGPCYVQGFMHGEGLLGPLPQPFQPILRADHKSGMLYTAYRNSQTGEIQIEDPRLGPLPENWRLRTHERDDLWQWFVNSKTGEGEADSYNIDPRLATETLRERGVNLVDIQLI